MLRCGLGINKELKLEGWFQGKAEQPAVLVVCLPKHQEVLTDQKCLSHNLACWGNYTKESTIFEK